MQVGSYMSKIFLQSIRLEILGLIYAKTEFGIKLTAKFDMPWKPNQLTNKPTLKETTAAWQHIKEKKIQRCLD